MTTNPVHAAPHCTLDVTQLESLAALQVPGEPSVVTEMVAMFVEEAEMRVDAARAALTVNDADALRRCGHTLRGACSLLGAYRLAMLAEALEDGALLEGADLPAMVGALADELTRLRRLLQPYLATEVERTR